MASPRSWIVVHDANGHQSAILNGDAEEFGPADPRQPARFDQSERGGLDGAGQRIKRANVVEAADERDSSISIAMRFLAGAAEALELVEPSQSHRRRSLPCARGKDFA